MTGEDDKKKGRQLELPIDAPRSPPGPRPVAAPAQRSFRVIKGEGKKRSETLKTRDEVVRLLCAAAADVMLHRLTPDRGNEIQKRVDKIMRLFDRPADDLVARELLRRELDELEKVYREGQR